MPWIRAAIAVAIVAVATGCSLTEDLSNFGSGAGATSGAGGAGASGGQASGGSASGGSGGTGAPSFGHALALRTTCASANTRNSQKLAFGTEPFTVELWFSVNELVNYQTLVHHGGTSPDRPGWGIELGAGVIVFGGSDGTNYVNAAAFGVILPQHHYHLVAVRDGSAAELWLLDRTRGETVHRLIGEEPMFPTSWDSAELFAIGDQASTNVQCVGYDLDGVMDELRIWSGRRTQEELDATYLTTVDCDTSGLIGYWRFEEATGGTIGNCAGPEVLQINDGTDPRDYQWVDSPFDE